MNPVWYEGETNLSRDLPYTMTTRRQKKFPPPGNNLENFLNELNVYPHHDRDADF